MKLGHTGFREKDLFMIYLNTTVFNNMFWARKNKCLIETFLLLTHNLRLIGRMCLEHKLAIPVCGYSCLTMALWCVTIIRGRLDLAVLFTPFTPNRQNSNQVVLEHLYRRTPATPSSKVV